MGNKLNIPDQIDEFALDEDMMLDEEELVEEELGDALEDENSDVDAMLLSDTIPESDLSGINSVSRYIQSLRQFKFLSAAEQKALWAEGTQEAREKIVNSHLPLVVSLVYKMFGFIGRSEPDILDMIQAGNHGLVIAANRFDPKKGTKFITYATYWIKMSINAELVSQGNGGMRKTVYIVSGIKTINKTEELLENLLGRSPTKDEVTLALAGIMGEQRINGLYEARQSGMPLSLDIKIDTGDGDACCIGDYVGDRSASIKRKIDEEDRQRIIMEAIKKVLTERERLIVEASFGLGEFNGEVRTGQQIAAMLKERGFTKGVVSKQAVNHDKLKALDKLKAVPAVAELYACGAIGGV